MVRRTKIGGGGVGGCLLRISYDVMSFNQFSLADWFKVMDEVDRVWSHALVLWIGNPQGSVEVVTLIR